MLFYNQATSKVAAVFIAPQHNVTRTVNGMFDKKKPLF